ncbi:MAG TPA: FAD synthetase family protein [Bacillales bacterium]|nr:FAD synthetase family protein [Bacillales bacterium]
MQVTHVKHQEKATIDSGSPLVMALGFFDGVHLGHQALLREGKRKAEAAGCRLAVMTFWPHPNEVLKGERNRNYLTPLSKKIETFAAFGVDQVFVVAFDRTFAALPARDFVAQYVTALNVRHVVVGFDFTFGFKAEGDVRLLRQLSKERRFGLSVVPKKTYRREKISSSALRQLLADGDLALVPYYLGRRYEIDVDSASMKDDKCWEIVPADRSLLPMPGRYHVEYFDGRGVAKAVFERFDDARNSCELTFVDSSGQRNLQQGKLLFINRIPSVEEKSG